MGILLLINLKEQAFPQGDLAWVNFVSLRCVSLFFVMACEITRSEFK